MFIKLYSALRVSLFGKNLFGDGYGLKCHFSIMSKHNSRFGSASILVSINYNLY